MNIIRSKRKLILYAFGAMGVNLLGIVVSSYLCSALIADGFADIALANHTYLGINLIIPAVWAFLGVIAKVIDGVIDIPMASLTDNLKTRWGRRRPAIILGVVPMVLAYSAFLLIPHTGGESIGNTLYYFILLAIFYTSYTLTMVTYYATFTEIVDNEKDRRLLTNTKSIADILYFIIGFAAVPMMLKGINIRLVALIVLPSVLLILVPLFMIKEKSTVNGTEVINGDDVQETKTVNLFKSIGYTFKNWKFVLWMVVYSFMTFGLQLFLSGINEYFSVAGMNMIFVMLAAFIPVPLTFMIYNKLNIKKGFGFAYQYTLLVFIIAMLSLFGVSFMEAGTAKTILSILCGLVSSFSVGAMFAVSYSIPSKLAADDEKETGISHSAMYFAVQGLFAGIASGIGGTAVLTILKTHFLFDKPTTFYITAISAGACVVAFVLVFILPKSLRLLGKETKEEVKEAYEE